LAVADYYQGVESESASALDHFGDAAGVDDPFVEAATVVFSLSLVAVASASATTAASVAAAAIAAFTSTGCW
jgi:hypothetical protein